MHSGAPCAAQIALKGALVMPAMGARPTGGQMASRPSCSGANSPGLLTATADQCVFARRRRRMFWCGMGWRTLGLWSMQGAPRTWQAAHLH